MLIALVLALRAFGATAALAEDPWVPEFKVEKYRLRNGLTVVLQEDHKTPLVAVNVTYNVGSKDDPPGRTGFAHLFEHLMYKGSQHSDQPYEWPIYPYLAWGRATTENDHTIYRTTVTSNALERVLWLEADRMGFLLPAVTEDKLANVRSVVMMERRQNWVDPSLSMVEETLNRALYPAGHPYHHMAIGSAEDLSAARLEDISAFYRRFYAPNHAFLCIAGNFRPALTRRWIQKYFGGLSPADAPAKPTSHISAPIQPCRITLRDRIYLPRVYLVWQTVPAYHPDEPAIDVLSSVLGGWSHGSRLFRALMDDRQIATEVSASHPTRMLAGRFEIDITATAGGGGKLDELVRVVDAEIERLKKEGPTEDEVRIARLERRNFLMQHLEPLTARARDLNDYVAACGDPLAYRSVLRKVFAVTPADVVRVARQYLNNARIELDVLPGERTMTPYDDDRDPRQPDHPAAPRPVPRHEPFDRSIPPDCPPTPPFVPPVTQTRRLSNGLEVRIIERHDLPQVVLKLVVRSGETSTPRGKEGLDSFAMGLLTRGTTSRSPLQLDTDLLKTGSTLSWQGLLESSSVTLTTATRRLEEALDVYADVILNPSFPDKELQRLKQDSRALQETRSLDPKDVSQDVFSRLLYHSEHPYARPYLGTPDSVRSVTRQDVISFYRQHLVPGNAALVVVGDVSADAIVKALETRFGKSAQGPIPKAPVPLLVPPATVGRAIYLIDSPGAEQSVVAVGRLGPAVTGSARYGLEILLKELEGRLATQLRDKKGTSYDLDAFLLRRNDNAPWILRSPVHKLDTTAALDIIFEVMDGMTGPDPITDQSIQAINENMVPDWFFRFECSSDVATEAAELVAHGMPGRQWARDLRSFAAVTEDGALRVAGRYLAPLKTKVLIVGDRAWIEPQLRRSRYASSIILLDSQGDPLPEPPGR